MIHPITNTQTTMRNQNSQYPKTFHAPAPPSAALLSSVFVMSSAEVVAAGVEASVASGVATGVRVMLFSGRSVRSGSSEDRDEATLFMDPSSATGVGTTGARGRMMT